LQWLIEPQSRIDLMKLRIEEALDLTIEGEISFAIPLLGGDSRKRLYARMLGRLEERGDAMRCVGRDGSVMWKCTPRLTSALRDLEAEAYADAADMP
jgi:hypothetical protein